MAQSRLDTGAQLLVDGEYLPTEEAKLAGLERLRDNDPERIGPYTIVARLGSGGMGVVFLGRKGAKRFAIKIVKESFLDDPSLRSRFGREIETLRKIDSDYVARITDFSTDGEFAWHATEFVNGPTLRELIESDGPLGSAEWRALAIELKSALEAIHAQGIIHRDIKPSNIIMSDSGAKLIDFGISLNSDATSITSTGTVSGSPAWLSPEQLEGKELSAGSDLFSAGSVLVFAATGRSPWGVESSMTIPAIYQKILAEDADFSGMTAEQKGLVSSLLEREPKDRQFVLANRDDVRDPTNSSLVTGLKRSSLTGFPHKRTVLHGEVHDTRLRRSIVRISYPLIAAVLVVATFLFLNQEAAKDSSVAEFTPASDPDNQRFKVNEFPDREYLQRIEFVENVKIYEKGWDITIQLTIPLGGLSKNSVEVVWVPTTNPGDSSLGSCREKQNFKQSPSDARTFILTCVGVDPTWHTSNPFLQFAVVRGELARETSVSLDDWEEASLLNRNVTLGPITDVFENVSPASP